MLKKLGNKKKNFRRSSTLNQHLTFHFILIGPKKSNLSLAGGGYSNV